MHFDWWTLALETVNFAVLVWLLQRFLYRPIMRAVDARRAEIEARRAEADKAVNEAKAMRAGIESERTKIAAEREAALKAAAAAAESAAGARAAKAERDAAALLEDARKTIATEREQALADARRAALDLGADIARRLLAEMPVEVRAEAWLERIERHVQSLSDDERRALLRQVSNGQAATVVTATPLPAALAAQWRIRLAKLFDHDVSIAFADDPKLVAGVELHLPEAILRFSWQNAIESIRSEIEADGRAR